MKKYIVLFFICISPLNVFAAQNIDVKKDIIIKNKLFSITLPKEMSNSCKIKKDKTKISIYHKESNKAGFGGFIFGVKAYKKPSDYAMMPGGKKIGELTNKKGYLYDMVLKYPTDVQYNYTKYSQPPKSFQSLYDYAENVEIKGVNGSKYFEKQGTKGENLYNDILKKHLIAINEKWSSEKLEKENMSFMYNLIVKTDKAPLNSVGYTYYDVNADGIEELLIGEIVEGSLKSIIYDIYTMVDRKPQHVVSGSTRNRFYVCNNSFLCNEYYSGAMETGVRIYDLVENSTELFLQMSFKYDGYTNKYNPYFISYSDEKWENVTEAKYKERKKIFEKYENFDYIPLSQFEYENLRKSEN